LVLFVRESMTTLTIFVSLLASDDIYIHRIIYLDILSYVVFHTYHIVNINSLATKRSITENGFSDL